MNFLFSSVTVTFGNVTATFSKYFVLVTTSLSPSKVANPFVSKMNFTSLSCSSYCAEISISLSDEYLSFITQAPSLPSFSGTAGATASICAFVIPLNDFVAKS